MIQPNDKVIGYFAYRSKREVVCTEEGACLISGTETAMSAYIREFDPAKASQTTIRKTRFGEILRGLKLGATYAFDETAYSRFYPLARRAGLPVAAADFAKANAEGSRFFTVRLTAF